ncbi:hypothetical protein N7479_005519 [Penicillium vulpinum]|nr:hypothetical protein N7479_005519 [Penicillium vulpinum]
MRVICLLLLLPFIHRQC